MSMLRRFWGGLRALFTKWREDGALDEELRDFLEQRAAAKMRTGVSRQRALREARMEMGSMDSVKENVRAVGWETAFDSFWQDVRYALRMLRKSPGFTTVAVLTLALGIGANTAIFSVVYAVLLRPLPYANPNQIVSVFDSQVASPGPGGFSYPNFVQIRRQNTVFSEMVTNTLHQLTLTGVGEPTEVNTSSVTPGLFAVFEAKPFAGRTFLPSDNVQGAAPVVILSEALWRSRFGANPNLIGQSISLDKRPFTVIGIMPASFRFPLMLTDPNEVWIPLVDDPLFGPWMSRHGGHWARTIARIKPGVSLAQAQAEMDAISARLIKQSPAENAGWAIRLEPLQTTIVGGVRTPLLVLLGAVGLVLLIACANIANLLLSRATTRAREFAVRMALGAGRSRIARQLLAECALLGLLGGAAGILLAYWGVQSLRSLLPPDLPQLHTISVDLWVLLFAFLLSVTATLVFGLVPSLFAADSSLHSTLKENSGRSGEAGSHQRARSFLAAAQIAIAVVLLVAAGLLIRSFDRLVSTDPGFNPQHVIMANIALPQYQYSQPAQWAAFGRQSLAKIQSLPGMSDSALAVPVPIIDGFINLSFTIVGNPPVRPGEDLLADFVSVSPNYFHLMNIPLLRGRIFNEQDSMPASRVAIISEALARRYFPNQDPLGKSMKFGFPPDGNTSREIVGIVGDVHDLSFDHAPGPMMYVPFDQAPLWGEDVVVRSSLSTSAVAAEIRQATASIDKDLPVTNILSLPEALTADPSVAQPRFRTLLLALFGAIALLLAAVGIFGVISYSVSRRTHELGVRMALGAQPGAILKMVLRETLGLVLIGIAVGLPCALGASRLVTHLLFNVKSYDPLTLILAPLVLVAVGVLAGYIPARRAMRVDPMIALRYE